VTKWIVEEDLGPRKDSEIALARCSGFFEEYSFAPTCSEGNVLLVPDPALVACIDTAIILAMPSRPGRRLFRWRVFFVRSVV